MKKVILIITTLSCFLYLSNDLIAQEKSLMTCNPTIISADPIIIGGGSGCVGQGGSIQYNGTDYQIWDVGSSSWKTLSTGTTSGGTSLWTQHSNGQDIYYNTQNVGIGSNFSGTPAPASLLSVGGVGNSAYAGYFTTAGNVNGAAGVYAELPLQTGAASNQVRAVVGTTEAGASWTYGVVGGSSATTPQNSGRAYGVRGTAGNATSGFNYAVSGRLSGTNDGAAIIGVDGDLHTTEGQVPGKWAGYFLGNGHFSDKVIIGTTTIPSTATLGSNTLPVSSFSLYVKSGILTEELIIADCANWADYVFEQDYNLVALEEVEAFIEVEGHLPNTPSAKEIEEGGLKISEITVNQQEKIEELFLHVIELNKQVKALQVENDLLKRSK